jgi:hypothetical protein
MEASVATPAAPAASEQANDEAPKAPVAAAPDAPEPEAAVEAEPTTPGTVHLIDGKAVDITSIESFLEQMAGDAGELWVKLEQAGGKAIAFLKSAVVAHE